MMNNVFSQDKPPVRVITFAMGNYYFALPLKIVFKVSPFPNHLQTDLTHLGLINFNSQTVLFLNLDSFLNPENNHFCQFKFLIIVRTQNQQLCAIPIKELPNMIDLAINQIQPLPNTAYESPIHQLSKYVVLGQTPETKPIFLLDLVLAIHFISKQQKSHFG